MAMVIWFFIVLLVFLDTETGAKVIKGALAVTLAAFILVVDVLGRAVAAIRERTG